MDDHAARVLLDQAIGADHLSCATPRCDVELAREAGFVYAAAFMLHGQTNVPTVEAAMQKIASSADIWYRIGTEWDEQWQPWLAANTRPCTGCEAFVRNDRTACGKCGAQLPAAA